MAYCDDCRADYRTTLWLAMPISLLWLDPDRVMQLLYELGLTASDPITISQLLDLPGPWVEGVQPLVAEYLRQSRQGNQDGD